MYYTIPAQEQRKSEAVRKKIDELRAEERASWELDQEIKKMQNEFLQNKHASEEFVPKPDSYWEELYETYLSRAHKVERAARKKAPQ